MSRKVPFASQPLREWPPDVVARWDDVMQHSRWTPAFAGSIRRAYGSFRGFLSAELKDVAGFTEPQCIEAFAHKLHASLTPKSVVTYLEHLMMALCALYPDDDRAWLVSYCREQRRQHVPYRPRRPTGQHEPRAKTLYLPVEDWPENIRAAWRKARYRPSKARRYRDSSQKGPAADWSEAYASRTERGLSLYLKFALDNRLSEMPSPHDIEQFINSTRLRVSSVSLASFVWEIWRAKSVIFPDDDWSWLYTMARDLKDKAIPSRNKVAQIVPISRLRKLGRAVLDRIEGTPRSVGAAVAYRDALMVYQLTFKPIRLSNLSAMRFGHELLLGEAGGSVFFPETKNKNPDGCPLSRELAKRFLTYRDVYRPLLKDAKTADEVWISKHAGPLAYDVISCIIGDFTEKHLGVRVNPHLFRDCVATSIAEHGPEGIQAASTLLGQRDPISLGPYARHAKWTQAAAHLDQLLERHRTRHYKATYANPRTG